jgi:hypothetical protein
MTVADIIELLGGRNAVAAYTGWPYTTIDSWQSSGHVPEWRRGKLLEMAVAQGKRISTADFPEKPARPQSAAA